MVIKRTFNPLIERDAFDVKYCPPGEGWASVDTRQDAPYFGTWTHPQRREIVLFNEGDIERRRCADDAEYVEELRTLMEWNEERSYWVGIDPMGIETIRNAFETLGLASLLH